MKKQRKASMVLGILSIILGLLSPAIGFILGVVGISIKKNEKKYSRDVTLNTLGIVISVINFLISFLILLTII